MAVLDWAHSGGLTADVVARLVPVLATGVHDPTLGFTDAFFHTAAQLQKEVAEAGVRRRTGPGDCGAGVDCRGRGR